MHSVNKENLIAELKFQGINDQRILHAINQVDRSQFVPDISKGIAYLNRPLSIGEEQTISQPYIVALSMELLDLDPCDRVLEIGTGSGYQAAILSHLCKTVYSIEIIPGLYEKSRNLLNELGYKNVHVRFGDGIEGWPEEAPFDKIVLAAAAPLHPEKLFEQLKMDGIMVAPVGEDRQSLIRYTKTIDGIKSENIARVLFVPMTGAIRENL